MSSFVDYLTLRRTHYIFHVVIANLIFFMSLLLVEYAPYDYYYLNIFHVIWDYIIDC